MTPVQDFMDGEEFWGKHDFTGEKQATSNAERRRQRRNSVGPCSSINVAASPVVKEYVSKHTIDEKDLKRVNDTQTMTNKAKSRRLRRNSIGPCSSTAVVSPPQESKVNDRQSIVASVLSAWDSPSVTSPGHKSWAIVQHKMQLSPALRRKCAINMRDSPLHLRKQSITAHYYPSSPVTAAKYGYGYDEDGRATSPSRATQTTARGCDPIRVLAPDSEQHSCVPKTSTTARRRGSIGGLSTKPTSTENGLNSSTYTAKTSERRRLSIDYSGMRRSTHTSAEYQRRKDSERNDTRGQEPGKFVSSTKQGRLASLC